MEINSFKHAKSAIEDFLMQDYMLYADVTTKDISKVILILSSSRSGSSLLYKLLQNTEQVLSLHGEHTPLYRLHGYCFPQRSLTSDYLEPSASENLTPISQHILAEVGVNTNTECTSLEGLICDTALRLILQWPQLQLSFTQWQNYLQRAAGRLKNWQEHGALLLELCNILQADGYSINPYYYDLPQALIRKRGNAATLPQGPPWPDYCIEEPPFIVVKPRKRATMKELRSKPLLMKASIDAYRLPFLRCLFPNAQFKIIHLTRNPAASVNGLIDGWHDHGFFSYNIKDYGTLSITGYSDRYYWGKHWWNYDLPPQWQSIANLPLEYVCSFQWYSAHVHILQTLSMQHDVSIYRVKFEDIIQSQTQRQRTLVSLLDYLDLNLDHSLQETMVNMPIVMATKTPSNRRWETRKNQIWPTVMQPPIISLARELGYVSGDGSHWI